MVNMFVFKSVDVIWKTTASPLFMQFDNMRKVTDFGFNHVNTDDSFLWFSSICSPTGGLILQKGFKSGVSLLRFWTEQCYLGLIQSERTTLSLEIHSREPKLSLSSPSPAVGAYEMYLGR